VSDMIVVLVKLSKMNATLFSLNYYLSVLMQKYNCVCSVKLFSQFLLFLGLSPSKCLFMPLKLRYH